MAEQLAEVEPFKTAIILNFMRDGRSCSTQWRCWCSALFIERFFCRYLCPLGAALAIPGRHAHVRVAAAFLFNYANGSDIVGNVALGRLQSAERWAMVGQRMAAGEHALPGEGGDAVELVAAPRIGPEKCVFIYNANQNRFRDNWFEGCEIGIHFTAGSEGNEIVGNAFVSEPQPGEVRRHALPRLVEGAAAATTGATTRPSTSNGDGIADTAYRPNDLIDQVLWTAPQAKVLINSPAVQVIRWAQAQFPALLSGRRRRQPSADGAAAARARSRRGSRRDAATVEIREVVKRFGRGRSRARRSRSSCRQARPWRSSATTAPARRR